MRSRSNDDAMAEMYCNDLEFALEMINAVLEDGDAGEFSIILRQLRKAFQAKSGVVQHDASELFQDFSGRRATFPTATAALEALGLQAPSQSAHPAQTDLHSATA